MGGEVSTVILKLSCFCLIIHIPFTVEAETDDGGEAEGRMDLRLAE